MYVAIIILGVVLLLFALFYASYSIRAGVYIKAYCRKRTARAIAALSFDDGPHPQYTPKILDLLKRYNVKAAFFVVGKNGEQYPEIVKRMVDEGHIVGNHTYSHSSHFPLMRMSKMVEELQRCDSVLENITGLRPTMFRPPYGVTNPMIAKAVRRRGYKVVGWDVRSLDTMESWSRTKVFERVRRRLRKGSVVLLHDNRAGGDELLEMILKHCDKIGFEVERVDNLLRL